MPNKYQVGTVGGIRKVINVKAATSTATTIQGLENTSITLAQLKTLLGNTTTTQPANPGTPSAGTQSLTVSNGTTSVANVTVIDVPSGINVSAPGGNTAVLAIPLPLTVTDGTHNVTAVSNLLFQNSVNVSSTTASSATIIMLPALKVTDGSTLATSIGEIIFTGAAVSTTSTNTSAVKVTITAGSLTVTDLSTVATSVTELIFSGASVSTTSTNTTAAKITITGGGGGSLTVTDGSTSVTSVTTLLFSGASVSTTGANEATVTVTGGSSSGPGGVLNDLQLWFQADQLSGNTTAGTLTFLPNSTPEGAGYVPAYAVAGGASVSSTALNSKTVIVVPGTGGFSLPGAGMYLPNSTVFAVLKLTSVASYETIIGAGSGQLNALQFRTNPSSQLELVESGISVIADSTGTLTAATWTQMNATYASGSGAYAFRIARTAAGSGSSAKTISGNSAGVLWSPSDNGQYIGGSVAEIIVYSRVLNSTEISNVESYLNTKWGV